MRLGESRPRFYTHASRKLNVYALCLLAGDMELVQSFEEKFDTNLPLEQARNVQDKNVKKVIDPNDFLHLKNPGDPANVLVGVRGLYPQ